MRILKIADTQFAHGTSLGSGDLPIYPDYFRWYRGNNVIGDLIVITESCFHLVDTYTERVKIAWILEPKSISPWAYSWIMENHHKFTYVLTHNEELIKTDPQKFKWYPFGGCWILPEDRKIYPKTKNVSIIASNKKSTLGHQLRHEVIAKYGHLIDGIYGRGYNPIENKLEALRNYRYSIVIENEISDTWFTEKLIDCFVTGTIPIFVGSNKVRLIFNNMLFFHCETLQDVGNKLQPIQTKTDNNITFGQFFYEKQLPGIYENSFTADKYDIPENWLWFNFFEKYFLNL